MARDRLAEVSAVRARRRAGGAWRVSGEIEALRRFLSLESGFGAEKDRYAAIRLVTMIEVFSREMIAEIIDSGDPYTSRAARLIEKSIKIDFALAQALVGKKLTFGELVAHDVQINGISTIEGVFSHLLDERFSQIISTVADRWSVEIEGKPPIPIISDIDETKRVIEDIFRIRHIVVHELPDEEPTLVLDMQKAVGVVGKFTQATEQAIATKLHGVYPLTQFDMNQEAANAAHEADRQLEAVMARFGPDHLQGSFRAAHAAWLEYRQRQAEFRSGINEPGHGSIAPLLYASEIEKITKQRIEDLEWYLDRPEGEM